MGDVLIAVNPFTDLPIYGKWVRRQHSVRNSCKSVHMGKITALSRQLLQV